MTRISHAALAAICATCIVSPALAQSSFPQIKPGSARLTMSGSANQKATPPVTLTQQQVAVLPKKTVGGQQLVMSNGQWSRLVALGGGKYQIVAQGGGN